MNCRELRSRIAPLLDGALSPRERREAEEHLERCPACRAEVLQAREVPLPRTPEAPAFPDDFWEGMDRALDEEAEREPGSMERIRSWMGQDLRVSRGAALVYGLVLVLALIFGLRGEGVPAAGELDATVVSQQTVAPEPPPESPPPRRSPPEPRRPPPDLQPVMHLY